MPPSNEIDPSSKASKKKRKNKKKGGQKTTNGDIAGTQNIHRPEDDQEDDDGDGDGEEGDVERNTSISEATIAEAPKVEDIDHAIPEVAHLGNGNKDASDEPEEAKDAEDAKENEVEPAEIAESRDTDHSDTTARLEAMAKDRDALTAEVAELRRSLESIQGKHDEELSGLKAEAEEAQTARDSAEEQYRTLLGKVNTIRSQLGERLKADAADLASARSQIEQLQDDNRNLKNAHQGKDSTIDRLTSEAKSHGDEISTLRSRSNLSTTNWSKERDDLNSQLAFAREEFENAKQAMQDWEVLAMEERSMRENLSERASELEEQFAAQRDAYERATSERDIQAQTVDGLQRALQDIQEARKRELREMVESSQAELSQVRTLLSTAQESATTSSTELESVKAELARALPFEKEVKEKNLLIGKLRHEAVILNDHLTKALRFLKRGKPEDNVDRQIVTNHLLHFLALDRGDPKKFQVLQLIAALLGWTEEQREQAGLARPGASNAQLRVPLSPFRRTPSTPSLANDFVTTPTSGSRESLAELWSDFLDREAQEGGTNRRESAAAAQRSISFTSPPPRDPMPGLGIRAASASNDISKIPESQ